MQRKNNIKKKSSGMCTIQHSVVNSDTSDFFATAIETSKKYQSAYKSPERIVLENRVAVVTCMDSRINIPNILGLPLEKMLIIRNAGGRVTDDVLRSLTISHKLLGVEQIFLIQHTDCGLQKITNDVMNNLLEESIFKAELIQNCNITLEPLQNNRMCQWRNNSQCCGYHQERKKINWLPIEEGLFESVFTDVQKIRNHPLIPSNVPVYCFIFEVTTGELIQVPKAMEAGRAKSIICT